MTHRRVYNGQNPYRLAHSSARVLAVLGWSARSERRTVHPAWRSAGARPAARRRRASRARATWGERARCAADTIYGLVRASLPHESSRLDPGKVCDPGIISSLWRSLMALVGPLMVASGRRMAALTLALL